MHCMYIVWVCLNIGYIPSPVVSNLSLLEEFFLYHQWSGDIPNLFFFVCGNAGDAS